MVFFVAWSLWKYCLDARAVVNWVLSLFEKKMSSLSLWGKKGTPTRTPLPTSAMALNPRYNSLETMKFLLAASDDVISFWPSQGLCEQLKNWDGNQIFSAWLASIQGNHGIIHHKRIFSFLESGSFHTKKLAPPDVPCNCQMEFMHGFSYVASSLINKLNFTLTTQCSFVWCVLENVEL